VNVLSLNPVASVSHVHSASTVMVIIAGKNVEKFGALMMLVP